MDLVVDIELLRRRLQGRFGVGLATSIESFDGGEFSAIRPLDLEVGNGFCVLISRTHRQVEASFRADNFSAGMLRRMAESDEQSRCTFDAIRNDAERDGSKVHVSIDGADCRAMKLVNQNWKVLEIDVTRRLGGFKAGSSPIEREVSEATSVCLALGLCLLPTEVVGSSDASDARHLPEGAKTRIEVNRYERNPANRAACIAHFGTKCLACGLDLEIAYGELAGGYIEVHHRVPVSKMGPGYFVDPIRDLAPLCANCHAIVHRTDPPLEVDELRRQLKQRNSLTWPMV